MRFLIASSSKCLQKKYLRYGHVQKSGIAPSHCSSTICLTDAENLSVVGSLPSAGQPHRAPSSQLGLVGRPRERLTLPCQVLGTTLMLQWDQETGVPPSVSMPYQASLTEPHEKIVLYSGRGVRLSSYFTSPFTVHDIGKSRRFMPIAVQKLLEFHSAPAFTKLMPHLSKTDMR